MIGKFWFSTSFSILWLPINYRELRRKYIEGDVKNDNRWGINEDGMKFKYFKLVNIVKICVNISAFTSSLEVPFSYLVISITSNYI